MKKFLSLVLALIMTMSLVTISAGATEYRDLTDKDEIQYEEAVAVLNRIGVITGYEDGSFRPETELTRGAAAKIIVSLMIGPDAASALPNNASPYPDVPAGHTFAGVIGYCKTVGYISGYGDGTFKPANPLTGYAFAKMLLGAIGYKSNIEGFVDTGWTMNVARIGNVAGLFDRLNFDGAKAVTRDEACQLALNTLKATMVDYGNANTVVSSSGEVLTVQGSKAQYVTSNNRDINANINRRVISATNNELTLEFGEEHFKDLRLEHDRFDPAYDIYGHPSNEWSYKKVTIGTFPLKADFTFTKQMSHIEDTVATKEKALGLRGYDTYSTDHKTTSGYSTVNGVVLGSDPFNDATQIHINGWNARVYNDDYKQGVNTASTKLSDGEIFTYDASKVGETNKEEAPSLSEIADLTDNGVTVEVYVCPVDADFITDVVVIRTQLMEVDRVATDYVELDRVSPDSKDKALTQIAGYNDNALHAETISVKDNNYDAYNVLKELKAGDEVAVIPYTADDGKTWEVGRAYVPETVSGVLTNVDIYNTKSKADGNAIAITVGGTTYPIAQWNKDMIGIDGYKIKASKKDVTLYLDELGNALLAKDVAASDNWIVVGDYYQAAGTNGRVGWFVHGWTIKGDEVDLELGTIRGAAEKYAPGELVQYRVAEAGNGEYELNKPNYNERSILKNGVQAGWKEPQLKDDGKVTGEGVYTISQFAYQTGAADNKYKIQSRNTLLPLDFYNTEKDKGAAYTVIEGDRYDYSQATSLNDVVAKGQILGAATAFYDKKDNYGVSDAAGTDSYNHWFYKTAPYDGVKFIYVGFDTTNGEVETINVVDGVQNVEYKELLQINRWWRNVGTNDLGTFVASPAEAYVDKNGKVKAVVIKSDSAEANLKDLMIITDNKGANTSVKSTGAEAPTSGTYYTRQYVSGEDGFKEEKTGYFDKALSVGTVVTGRLGADNIVKARTFHATEYTNRNPDGIYVKGIAPLYTLEGKKADNAFYVGPLATTNDATVTNPEVRKLGTGVDGDAALNETACDILSGKDVLGVNDNTPKKGLIKVDSTTQFIDLRDGRPGDIDEIGDLFDLNNNKDIELKIILNGNSNSDGFRHAYAIMILEAGEGPDDAKAPTVNVLGKVGTQASTNPSKGDGKTLATAYEFTVDEGTEIKLTALVSNITGVEKDAKWTETATGAVISTTKEATVTAPATVKFQVTNRDTSVENRVETTTTVYVKVGAAATEPTRTLTLGGALLVSSTAGVANSKVNVYAGSDGKASSNVVNKMLNGVETSTATYQIPAGKLVTISKGAFAKTDDLTIPVDGVNVTIDYVDGTNDLITFTMPDKDFTLNMADADKFVNEDGSTNDTQVYVLKSVGGVTGTFKDGTTNEETPLTAGGEIAIKNAGTFTVTSTGDGTKVITAKYETTVADAKGVGETISVSAANTTLYAASLVRVTGTSAQAAGGGVTVSAGTDAYVATGIELTVSGFSGNKYLIGKTDLKIGDAATSLKVTTGKDVYINGAHEVTLDGVTATHSSGAVTSGQVVASGESLTLAAPDADHVPVKLASANTNFAEAVTAAETISGAASYASFTKVTFASKLDSTTTVEFEVRAGYYTSPVAIDPTKTYGFKSGAVVRVTGVAGTAGEAIKLGTTDVLPDNANDVILAGAATTGTSDKPTGLIQIGETALALSQGAKT